jgi:hypothetical protein
VTSTKPWSPSVNAAEVEVLDDPKLSEQALASSSRGIRSLAVPGSMTTS